MLERPSNDIRDRRRQQRRGRGTGRRRPPGRTRRRRKAAAPTSRTLPIVDGPEGIGDAGAEPLEPADDARVVAGTIRPRRSL